MYNYIPVAVQQTEIQMDAYCGDTQSVMTPIMIQGKTTKIYVGDYGKGHMFILINEDNGKYYAVFTGDPEDPDAPTCVVAEGDNWRDAGVEKYKSNNKTIPIKPDTVKH